MAVVSPVAMVTYTGLTLASTQVAWMPLVGQIAVLGMSSDVLFLRTPPGIVEGTFHCLLCKYCQLAPYTSKVTS